MSIVHNLINAFRDVPFTLKQAYAACPEVNQESVRARIYEHLAIEFERLGKGLYVAKDADCILIEGDGRDLSMLEDASVDCIITDHPWDDGKSNKGGNRCFAQYDCLRYTIGDFLSKARILKEGSFLVEILPAENERNFDYLYQIKKMAQKAGLEYYAKVPWKKGTFVSNTGRKSKNTEELMIFSKGKARSLRLDAKKTYATSVSHYMSGTNGMLPTEFDVQPVLKKEMICQTEKPSLLFEQLLQYLTLENELILDQFAGSGAVGEACVKTRRKCILIEKSHEQIEKIKNRLALLQVKVAHT